jgi:hypothetical protein
MPTNDPLSYGAKLGKGASASQGAQMAKTGTQAALSMSSKVPGPLGAMPSVALEALLKAAKQFYQGAAENLFMTQPAMAAEIVKQAEQPQQMNQQQLAKSPTVGAAGQMNNQQSDSIISNEQNTAQAMFSKQAQSQPGMSQPMAGDQPGIPSRPNIQPSSSFFSAGGYDPKTNTVKLPGAFMNTWGLQRIKALQEISGMQPMQIGEQQKQIMQQDTELAKTAASQKLDMYKFGIEQERMNRNDLSGQSKGFDVQVEANQKIEQLVKDYTNNGQFNISAMTKEDRVGLLYNYIKTLDPNSVVREGETGIVLESTSLGEDFKRKMNYLLARKGKMSDEQVKGIINDSRRQYKGALSQQKKRDEEYRRIAAGSGLRPEYVVPERGLSSQKSQKKGGYFSPSTNKYYDEQGNEVS